MDSLQEKKATRIRIDNIRAGRLAVEKNNDVTVQP